MKLLKTFDSFNFNTINESKKTEPKFKVGDKVNYIPKLSGLSPKKELIIKNRAWKDKDDLSSMLGVEFKPTWFYSFNDSNLMADEKDIKLVDKASNISEGKKVY
jgi:hypothetical protein